MNIHQLFNKIIYTIDVMMNYLKLKMLSWWLSV